MGSDFSNIFIDVYSLDNDTFGFVQLIYLTLTYGFILFIAATLIFDGSEYLLLIPSISGIVGTIILPVLAAVPDAAIVIYSGISDQAQASIEVGLGSLAGSTILLLTVAYFMVIWAGRVNIKLNGKANYKNPKLDPPENMSLFGTGVVVSTRVKSTALFVLGTSAFLWFIEGPAIAYYRHSNSDMVDDEKPFAITAAILALLGFMIYLTVAYFWLIPEEKDWHLIEGLKEGKLSLVAAVAGVMQNVGFDPHTDKIDDETVPNQDRRTSNTRIHDIQEGDDDIESPLLRASSSKQVETPARKKLNEVARRLQKVLRESFLKYDIDNSGGLDIQEVGFVMHDLGEPLGEGK